MKQNEYFIGYLNRQGEWNTCFIKARTENKAQVKFYKEHKNLDIIVKISLV